MPSVPEKSIEISSRHQVYLEGLKTHEQEKVKDFLRSVDREVTIKLAGKDLTEYNRTRLNRLLVSIKSVINKSYKTFREDLYGTIADLGVYEADFEVRALAQVTNFEYAVPTPAQINSAVFSTPLSIQAASSENLLESFIEGLGQRTQSRISNAIRSGFVQGESTGQILQRVRGTRAGRFRDGILSNVDVDARTIVRTSLQHVAEQARQRVWDANKRIIKGVVWVSTLDGRTSSQCRTLDGQFYDLEKGPRPPIHPNCRSRTVPELDERFDILKEDATRFSRSPDGSVKRVSAETSYYDWLKKQPQNFQDSVLGPNRGKLLRSGGLSSQRFAELQLNKRFKPLTLSQMRELDPIAFDKAGI